MNKNSIYRLIVSFLMIGVFHSLLLGQRNPREMKFNNHIDSLFFVFNPETSSVDSDFHQNFKSDYLLNMLKSDNEHFQVKSLFLLGYKNDIKTIEPVANLLSHQNEKLVKQAIRTLEKIHYSESSIHLGTALIENIYTDKHIKGYIIHALINLTFIEGVDFLNKFLAQNETGKLYDFFRNLALEGVDIIIKYNRSEESQFELVKKFLTLKHKKRWALNKIILEKEEGHLWLPELRKLEGDIEVLLLRKELGETSFSESEKYTLDNMRKRKTCE